MMFNSIRNIKDFFGLGDLSDSINKVIQLREQYGSTAKIINVGKGISIEFASHIKTCYVRFRGKRVVKYIYGTYRQYSRSFMVGSTFGFVKGPITLLTRDKEIADPAFIKKMETTINNHLGTIEHKLKEASKAK